MEHQRKRTCPIYPQQPSQASELTTMAMPILDQFPIQDDSQSQRNIQNTLAKLDQDVTAIKTNLEKKRPKVTLKQVNDKLDMILHILSNMNKM